MKHQLTALRLKEAMEEAHIAQRELADKAQINEGSVSQYIHGTYKPGNINAGKMGEVLNVNPMWLMGFDVPKYVEIASANSVKSTRVPVLGMVAAGSPIEAIENIRDYVDIPSDWVGDYRGFIVHGDSMSPRIQDGDILIVRRQSDAESGDIVVAMVDGNATVKKLIKHKNSITLQPFNPSYEPMYFENGVKLWGKVVEFRAKL